jgi:hypothetical protein
MSYAVDVRRFGGLITRVPTTGVGQNQEVEQWPRS